MIKTRNSKWIRNASLIVGIVSLLSISCDRSNDAAKNLEVEGWVTDLADKKAIPGASIVVKGMERGTSTDADGHFKIFAPDTAELVVSYDGFDTETRPLKGIATQMIALKSSSNTSNSDSSN